VTWVLLERDDTIVVRHAGPVRKAMVRLFGPHWDQDLAAGVSADTSVEHSLRAQYLVMTGHRSLIADAICRIMAQAGVSVAGAAPSGFPMQSPRTRRAVRACAGDLQRLAERLRAPGPVSPRGVALAELLVTDGAGPLHYGGDAAVLRAVCLAAEEALDPSTEHL